MKRLLAVCLFVVSAPALGQYPWSPTKTPIPTRRPTLVPTRPPVPTIAATTPTPVPSSPPATPGPVGGTSITIQLSTIVTGAIVNGFEPARYEVRVGDAWYTLVPRVGCWTSNGVCVALGLNPYLRVTARNGSVKEGPVRLSQPRVLLAQAVGPVNLVSFTTPQIQ